ncbi:5-formyltetrahydrofolate cyclo-ligase [uncultured Corynebacterium sp.]|uniref:5-formyltetrahydrofolate cyclo-ligase n=1 Tax=uncultured Corynebacterium sp. TaxID=159447 RepID=UPI0025FD7E4F|nr:5-formyltetrahydrofolate cyclo-ligase [uncultured Corynebacterium sp.]
MSTIKEQKRRLRSEIRQRRTSVSCQERALSDRNIQKNLRSLLDQLYPKAVCAFSPMPGEPGGPDLPQYLTSVLPSDVPIFLPRVISQADRSMEWVQFSGELEVSHWGIPEPVGEPVSDAFAYEPLMILPALAIDYDGRRLGQGGGFYDTVFARKPRGIISCAIVDDIEIIDHVPTEDHDLAVDYIISGAAVVQKKGI